MKFLLKLLEGQAHHFEKGGKLEKLYPLWEAQDTFLFTPPATTRTASHVRDGLDTKRLMITVIFALGPAILMAIYNTGYQAHRAISMGAQPLDNWQTAVYQWAGLGFDPGSILACAAYGALFFFPIMLATYVVGGVVEVTFAIARRHEISEGFLVTGMLIPLTLPPTIPLWMVGLGAAFGIIFGKEVFGGVGMNWLNPALTARAFLFFAYPAFMSGEAPWIAADFLGVDSFAGATLLAQSAASAGAWIGNADWSWWESFVGLIPGSMGETSALACFIGAGLLIQTQIGSWRTMAGVTLGTLALSLLFNAVGSETNPMFGLPFHWHIVLGGWAFGMVFMATDPVSSAYTNKGKWFYGIGIGVMVMLVRVVNPAYPEGMMLAILFMNMFAPLIDYYVIKGNINRRLARAA